jgi:hypothetical protein
MFLNRGPKKYFNFVIEFFLLPRLCELAII